MGKENRSMKGMAKRFKRMDDDLWPTFRDSKKNTTWITTPLWFFNTDPVFPSVSVFCVSASAKSQDLDQYMEISEFFNAMKEVYPNLTDNELQMLWRYVDSHLVVKIWQIWRWELHVGRNPWCSRFGTLAPVNVMYLIDWCPWGICCFDKCCLGLYLRYMIYVIYFVSIINSLSLSKGYKVKVDRRTITFR